MTRKNPREINAMAGLSLTPGYATHADLRWYGMIVQDLE
jgi:hypothetical protein